MNVWIIEQNYGNGDWRPMVTESGEIEGSTNFYEAHRIKRELVDCWWDISKAEEKRNFRVRQYAPKANRRSVVRSSADFFL